MTRLLLLAVLLPALAHALPPDTRPIQSRLLLPDGGSPIPVAYDAADANSRIITGLTGYSHVKVVNDTTCPVVLNSGYDAAAPIDGDPQNFYEQANTGINGEIKDGIFISGSIYLRADALCGPITSGTIIVEVW